MGNQKYDTHMVPGGTNLTSSSGLKEVPDRFRIDGASHWSPWRGQLFQSRSFGMLIFLNEEHHTRSRSCVFEEIPFLRRSVWLPADINANKPRASKYSSSSGVEEVRSTGCRLQ